MKISIFPEAKPHPSSKEEKIRESFKVSNPYLPQTVEIANEDALIKYVTSYAWSPFIFDGVRHADNFVSCDFLVYDIDEGLTIEKASEILDNTNYCYLILPSPSHTAENHRFRVILPLSHSIMDFDTYSLTWRAGAELLGSVDEQTKDLARYFFASRDNDGFADFSKDFFNPIKKHSPEKSGYTPSQTVMMEVPTEVADIVKTLYGEERDKIPEAVHYFITNAHTGLKGNWTNSLNSAAFSLSLSNVAEDVIIAVLDSLCPEGGLDKKDLYQVNKAIRDGQKTQI